MQPDLTKVLGELLADHEIAQRKQIEPLAARVAELEARPVMDADLVIRDALSGEIDVLAPADVVEEMRGAVLLLAEPAPVKKTAEADARSFALRPRSFRFDRDAQNRIVAAHEEFEGDNAN